MGTQRTENPRAFRPGSVKPYCHDIYEGEPGSHRMYSHNKGTIQR